MKEAKRKQKIIDGRGVALGRLASKVAMILMGKDKKSYEPRIDEGGEVLVKNVDQIKLTGNKLETKVYYKHTTHPGSLQKVKLKDLVARKGMAEILRRAVNGMIPKNRRRQKLMQRLFVR